MSYNKFMRGNDVLLDLTSDTVDASHLGQGYTAHDRSGNLVNGTAIIQGGGGGFEHFATGEITPTADWAGNASEASTNAKVTVGFKAKIFYIYTNNNFNTNSSTSPYGLSSSFYCENVAGSGEQHWSTFTYYQSSRAYNGRSGGGTTNGFKVGASETTMYLQQASLKLVSNTPYKWFAWG